MSNEEQVTSSDKPVIPGLVPYAIAQYFDPPEFERLYGIPPAKFGFIAAEWRKHLKLRVTSKVTAEDRLIIALLQRQGYGEPALEKAGVDKCILIHLVYFRKRMLEKLPRELDLPPYKPMIFAHGSNAKKASSPRFWGKARTPRCRLLTVIKNNPRFPGIDMKTLQKAQDIIADELAKELAKERQVKLPGIGTVRLSSGPHNRILFRMTYDMKLNVFLNKRLSPSGAHDSCVTGSCMDQGDFLSGPNVRRYDSLIRDGRTEEAEIFVESRRKTLKGRRERLRKEPPGQEL